MNIASDSRGAMRSQRENARARLLAAAQALLEERSLIEIGVRDITARAGLSNAAFYLHFKDVYDIVLAACETAVQSTPELLGIVEAPWTAACAKAQAEHFVAEYFRVWDRHRAILRARNHAADEGKLPFSRARECSVVPLSAALTGLIARRQAEGPIPRELNPRAVANALLALMERTGAVQHDYEDIGPGWHSQYMAAVTHALLASLGFRRSGENSVNDPSIV